MPVYAYKARDIRGEKVVGSLESVSRDQALQQIDKRGLILVDLKEKSAARLRLMTWPEPEIKKPHLVLLTRQLSTLLKAGVPVLAALDNVIEQTEQKMLTQALLDMRYDIESGANLSESMKKHPRVFPSIYTACVVAGESGGVMTKILDRLADILEHEADTEAQIKAALRYPLIVLAALAGAFIFLTTVVIPTFMSLFNRISAQLPWITKLLIATNVLLRNYWPAIMLGGFAAYGIYKIFVKWPPGRAIIDRWLLAVPMIGPLLKKIYLARFTHMMGLLLDSGMTVLGTLDLVARAAGNKTFEIEILKIEKSVRKGEGFAKPLKDSGFFPPLVATMSGVGEASGSLSEMFMEMSRYYDRDVRYTVVQLTKWIEPVLIFVLSIMVLIFALGIFLPMWDYYRILVGGQG